MTNVVLALTTDVLVQHLIAVTHTTLCVVQLTMFVLYLRAPFMPLFEVKAGHWLLVACFLVVCSHNNHKIRFNFFPVLMNLHLHLQLKINSNANNK